MFSSSDLILGNFHIAYNSPCVDAGDPNETDVEELDMDEQGRIAGETIDIGADEVDCCEIYNICDFDGDGRVVYGDFSILSRAWITFDPNNPNISTDPNDSNYVDPNCIIHWNPICDLDDDLDVDEGDLALFIPQWCWVACWRYDVQEMQQQMSMLAMSDAEGFARSEPVLSGVEEMASPAPSISVKISPPVETVAVAEETAEPIEADPAAEREQVLSLLEDIDALIDTGGDDAETWIEIKNLLEQTLVETEDTINDPNGF